MINEQLDEILSELENYHRGYAKGIMPFEAKQSLLQLIKEDGLEIELYYLEKLGKVYDDIVSGVAKKQTNSTYYVTKAIHTEEEIKHITDRIKELKESK